MKNININSISFRTITIAMALITTIANAQNWYQNDGVYNTSGVPSLTFSAPRFADLDNDNDFDLVLSGSDSPPVMLENIGSASNPSFSETGFISHNITALEADLCTLADLDNDGDFDLIASGYGGLTYFNNTGSIITPSFTRDTLVFAGLNVGNNPAPTIADINGDGAPDLIIGLSESGALKYYINSGSSTTAEFLESNAMLLGIDVGLYAYPELVDPDGDGDWDLLVGRDDLNLYYYRNDGTAQEPNWSSNNSYCSGLAGNHYFTTPTMVDLNGNGLLDIVYGHYGGLLNYFNNTGTANNPVWTENLSPFGGNLDVGGASNPCMFDWDADGDLDLISGFNMGGLKYFHNIGTVAGSAWEAAHSVFSAIEGESIYSSVAVGDLDNNGYPDLVMGFLTNVLVFYENTGSQYVANTNHFNNLDIGWWLIPRLMDMDNDYDLDVVVANDDGDLHYFETQGTITNPSFVLIGGYFSGINGPSNSSPALADYDSDGDIDILLGGISGDLEYYENTGTTATPVWTENSTLFSNVSVHQNAAPAFGDLDGDGDLDLTIGAYNGTFSYFENRNPIVSIENDQPTLPNQISVNSVFPNPFNRSATFSIAGEKSGKIIIDIYDLAGRHHRRHSAYINAGESSLVTITMPLNAGSGVYMYQVSDLYQKTIKSATGKIIYLK